MAVKILSNTGGDYSDWASWVVYLRTLNSLTATEVALVSGEFNGGNAQLTGASIYPSSAFPLVIEPVSGTKYSGNPLRYVDGARVLLDGANEEFYLNWQEVIVRDLAFYKSGAATTTFLGCVGVAAVSVSLENLIIVQPSTNATIYGLDDRGSLNSTRNNIIIVKDNANACAGFRCANLKKTYVNCNAHAFGTQTGSFGFTTAYASISLVNCISLGFTTDYKDINDGIGAATRNCATHMSITASRLSVVTSAQFDVSGAAEFENYSSFSAVDLRLKSTAIQLLDTGYNATGTTSDILRNSISNSIRDIGAFEYQQVSGGGGGGGSLPYATLARRRGFMHTLRFNN